MRTPTLTRTLFAAAALSQSRTVVRRRRAGYRCRRRPPLMAGTLAAVTEAMARAGRACSWRSAP